MSTRLRTLLLSLALVAGSASAAPVQLSLPTLDGKTFDVAALRGQWIVVNYWATWCGPCIKEMPELDELDHAREDVTVIGLAFEETTPEDLKSFIAERKVSYAIAAVDPPTPRKIFLNGSFSANTRMSEPSSHAATIFSLMRSGNLNAKPISCPMRRKSGFLSSTTPTE